MRIGTYEKKRKKGLGAARFPQQPAALEGLACAALVGVQLNFRSGLGARRGFEDSDM
jgi:hypothetical protein